MTQAIILAGGKGTRLAAVAPGVPKPLVPVAGVPVVERQIRLLARYGIRDILLTTGHLAGTVSSQLGDGSAWDVRLRYFHEREPLGTAGGVAALVDAVDDDVLVLYGDVLVNMDLARLIAFHAARSAVATVVVHPNDHPFDSDLVELDAEDRILAFHPYPRAETDQDLPNQVSAGLYLLSRAALGAIARDQAQDFVRDVFPRLLAAGQPVYGYRTTEYLKDMGTPDRLRHVEADVASGRVAAMHADQTRPTVFLDRDGVINEERDGVLEPDQLGLIAHAGAAIRRLNAAGWLAVAVTNQPAVAKGFMTEEALFRVHVRLQALLGREGAWLDWLAFCPHHPESGFEGERPELKIRCTCRKPETGMLEACARAVPVARDDCVMVGDSWRDMVAGHRFGADAIGVRTGHGMNDPAPEEFAGLARPDLLVEDLAEAVTVLLEADPAVEDLAQLIQQRLATAEPGQGPLTVLIGGLSRSGKSTLSFRLARRLRRMDLQALRVRLDDWLVPASRRAAGSSVRDRFQLDRLNRDLAALRAGGSVVASGYDERTREQGRPVAYRSPGPGTVLLVEGVPALLLDRDANTVTVYVDAQDEDQRLHRVRRLYQHRGLDAAAVDELLAGRREEHRTITASGMDADMRVPRYTWETATGAKTG